MIHRRGLLAGLLAAACDAKSTVTGHSLRESTNQARFVAVNGNDSNPGTEIAPVRTFARGLSLVTPGTTLFIKGGIYREAMEGNIPSGVSWDAPVRVAAYQSQAVTLSPVGAARVLHFEGQSYIIIDGLILDGGRRTIDGIKITSGGGAPAHHIRIQNTEVKNASSQGILLTLGAHSNHFINVRVHDNGQNDFDHGIYVSTDDNVIESCEIFRNAGWGVHAWEFPNRLTVRGCRIYQNARAGARGPGIGLYGGQGLRALDNEVLGNAAGIVVDFGATNAEVTGNRVFNNRGHGILVGGDAIGTRVAGNISEGNGEGNVVDQGRGTRLAANRAR